MSHRILIIDDSEDIHPLIEIRLAGQDMAFESAYSGEAGIAAAEREPPDLILLDIDMPGMDGLEVCRQLKASRRTESVPVIFLTGASSSAEKLNGLAIGAIDYITKPFDPAELSARVRTALQVHDLLATLASQNANLQKSEERFRILAENGSDIIFRLSADGACLYVSPASRALLGYEPDELTGRKIYDLIHPEDVPEAVRALAMGVETSTWASRFRREDDSYVWLETTARTILQPDTKTVREFHASSRDITLRKQTELLEQDRAVVLEAIAENKEIGVVLENLVRMAERQYRGAVASVDVVSDGRTLHVAPNLTSEQSRALEAYVLAQSAADGSTTTAVQAVSVADFAADPRWAGFGATRSVAPFRSCWWVSLRSSGGGLLGAFIICHRQDAQLDQPARALLDLVGKLLIIGLEHRHIATQLAHSAHHDPLTGLPNRVLFEDRLGQAIARSARTGESVALQYIDLDRFKFVNDTLGHQAGDLLLTGVVQRFQQALRKADTLARMGGDEFALIVPELKDASGADVVAQKLINSLQAPFDLAGREVYVTASIGVALYPKDAVAPLALQKCADAAMYRAKASGTNRSQIYLPEMTIFNSGRLELANDLRRALENDELTLHYQPLVDRESIVVGFEALVRWNHPKLGLLAPGQFIPLAEETGLILPIGTWVMREAVRRNREWQLEGLRPVQVGVNVSAIQFAQPDFVEVVRSALAGVELEPGWLELELTETMLMQNLTDAQEKLKDLRTLGVRVAIDDFGTGYSSLAYLSRLPVDTLKIDRCFVNVISGAQGRSGENDPTAVIRAIVLLADNLGMRSVAEGVETQVQRTILLDMGCCTALQGFLFGRPCAPAAAAKWLSGDLKASPCYSSRSA